MFHEYISCLLRDNSIIECFIEGGRSRSGKLLNPKFGFLKVLVDLLEEDLVGKRIPDITIFPVAISYDKVVEGTAYVREMMGSSKEKESLSGFISAVQALNKLKLSLGTIDIRFAEPFSLRDAMITGKYGPVNGVLHRKRFMMHLSHRVLHECNKISSVPATAVVAAVLLTTQHRGIHIRSLVSRVQWLCQELSERGARLSKVFQIKSMALAVEKSLAVLGKVTKRRNDIIFGFQEVHSLELSIYRNQMIHWFVSEALIAVALVRIITSKSPNQDPFSIKVPPKELLGMSLTHYI